MELCDQYADIVSDLLEMVRLTVGSDKADKRTVLRGYRLVTEGMAMIDASIELDMALICRRLRARIAMPADDSEVCRLGDELEHAAMTRKHIAQAVASLDSAMVSRGWFPGSGLA
jgi:hypothetical protein